MTRINIAVASPGDVPKEREAVPKVLTRWNSNNEHATLHPLMWESASVPALGDHPQHLLDERIISKSEYTTVEHLERDLYPHLDAKVSEFLQGKLPPPEPVAAAPKGDSAAPKRHPDPRLRELTDFGARLEEIAAGFAGRLDQFDATDGAGPDTFLDLAAHVYYSAASCLDRFLTFSAAGMTEQNKGTLERISTRLKQLAASSEEYLKRPFPQYWKDGREICDALGAHVRFLSDTSRA